MRVVRGEGSKLECFGNLFLCACLSGLGHAVYESLSDEDFSRLSLLSVPERVSVVTAAVNSHCNAT